MTSVANHPSFQNYFDELDREILDLVLNVDLAKTFEGRSPLEQLVEARVLKCRCERIKSAVKKTRNTL